MCTQVFRRCVCVRARNAPSEFGDFFLPPSRVHERSLLIVSSHTIYYYMRRYLLGRFIVSPSSRPASLQLYMVPSFYIQHISCHILYCCRRQSSKTCIVYRT